MSKAGFRKVVNYQPVSISLQSFLAMEISLASCCDRSLTSRGTLHREVAKFSVNSQQISYNFIPFS